MNVRQLPFSGSSDRDVAVKSVPFISYAQNFEDVILRRCFPGKDGFYIDVGAQDPNADSVTLSFYRQGWRGINIEPTSYYFRRLQRHRPRDINLQLAASDYEGTIDFYEINNSGLSTSSNDFAERAKAKGFVSKETVVPCMTLDQICHDHGVEKIDFLKIDVEGAEGAVLRGMALEQIRPKVLVIEATEPCSPKPNYQEWESYVTDHGYKMVYDDGLNRFYLAKEHSDLEKNFVFPPNVFDKYVRPVSLKQIWNHCATSALEHLPSGLRRQVAACGHALLKLKH